MMILLIHKKVNEAKQKVNWSSFLSHHSSNENRIMYIVNKIETLDVIYIKYMIIKG